MAAFMEAFGQTPSQPAFDALRAAMQGDEAETAHLRNLPGASDRLRLFQIDLLDPDSILAAIRGCAGVFHLASPCTVNSVQNPQRELLDPAVKGTLNVLCTAKESGVCRVVVTSSISAIIPSPGWPADRVKDESCWTNLDYCRQKEAITCILLRKGGWIMSLTIPFVALGFFLVKDYGSSEKHLLELLLYTNYVVWWVTLGVASSIGLGRLIFHLSAI
ncbi:cinnamoyl-CoA reductase 1-like [Curcuma longa]|uniref:cinnamoyl-CoA reductase 1-like n=1 Tax=Curcuma longa TaxID=136217 RepID=UPI003D9F601B